MECSPFAIEGDYSNEISDTLYCFIAEENRLVPIFTQQPGKPIQHDCIKLPEHYLIDIPTGYVQEQYETIKI